MLVACGREQVQRGDVVLFRQKGKLVAHRVWRITQDDGSPILVTKGDSLRTLRCPVAQRADRWAGRGHRAPWATAPARFAGLAGRWLADCRRHLVCGRTLSLGAGAPAPNEDPAAGLSASSDWTTWNLRTDYSYFVPGKILPTPIWTPCLNCAQRRRSPGRKPSTQPNITRWRPLSGPTWKRPSPPASLSPKMSVKGSS